MSRTPPGSENGAGVYGGNTGTWESHLFPYRVPEDEVYWEYKRPGVEQDAPPLNEPMWDTNKRASKVSWHERQSEVLRDGQVAVVAAHSTCEGGEVKSKRPAGGKARPGITISTGDKRWHTEATYRVNKTCMEREGQRSYAPEGKARSLWFVMGEGHRLAACNDRRTGCSN